MNTLYKKYELPYNFDKKLIDGYKLLQVPEKAIDCIYMPPLFSDYESIIRNNPQIDIVPKITYEEYLDHVNYINEHFPDKLQLLLQRTDGYLMPSYLIKKYIGLGFRNFCVGTLEQAKIIKNIDPTIRVVGSIAMHITPQNIDRNYDVYKQYFNAFVLDFSYNKNFLKIKSLPKGFEYMTLVNSRCNTSCDGDHHWWGAENMWCPGLGTNADTFHTSCMIRPMDLYLFEPYISVFKIQDRGWKTHEILREVVLYTTNYGLYPNLKCSASIYQSDY